MIKKFFLSAVILTLISVAAYAQSTVKSFDFTVTKEAWAVQKGAGAMDNAAFTYEYTGLPAQTDMGGAVLLYTSQDGNYWFPVNNAVTNTTYGYNNRAVIKVTVKAKEVPAQTMYRVVVITSK